MDINGIHHISGAHGVSAPHFAENAKNAANTASAPIQDEIEISTTAERLSAADSTRQIAEGGEIRYDLVNQIREQIAAGTYDTPERFDVAMERLLSRLG